MFCRVRSRSDVTTICWNKGKVTRGIIQVGAETKEVRTSYWRPPYTGTRLHFWNFLLKSNCSNARNNRKLDDRTRQSTWPNFREIPNISLPGTNVVSHWGRIRVIKAGRMRRPGHLASVKKKRNTSRVLVGKTEEKRQRGRTRRRWGMVQTRDLIK